MGNTTTTQPTLADNLEAFLTSADQQIGVEKKNKEQRAVDTLAFFYATLNNWKTSGKVTLFATLVQRSEFSGLLRVMVGTIVNNVTIEGKPSKTKAPTIKCDGNNGKPMFVTPMLDSLLAFTQETDDNGKAYRIDSADVKDMFGIPMSEAEKLEKAHNAIKSLQKRKINGVLLTDILTAEQVTALDNLIAHVTA